VLRTLDPLPAAVVEVPAGKEFEAIATLEADPAVAYAELDTLAYAADGLFQDSRPDGHAASTAATVSATGRQPNDPGWAQQWAPRRVDAPEAWQLTTGSDQVVVAVVDSGIDLTHAEFAGRVLSGYDYVQGDTVPQDEYGHGTHVAGIIAAAGDNQAGVAGLAWQAKILPLRVLDRDGSGTASNVASAISNAANRRVAVINLSLVLGGPNNTVLNAILFARGNGVMVVASTGNDTQPGQALAPVRYPASYPEVVAVAATTHWEDWSSYSNGGPEVDLAAPGGETYDRILSTGLGGGATELYGTSMAAAHVSGVVALLRSQTPSATQAAIEDALRSTAAKVGSYPYSAGRNDRLGYGRVDAAAAVRWITSPNLVVTPDTPTLLTPQGETSAWTPMVLANPSTQPLPWQVVSIYPGWLQVSPAAGTLIYPVTVPVRLSLTSAPPLGLTSASVVVRTTDPGGQQRDIVVTVRVVVAPQLRYAYMPTVGKGSVTHPWQDIVGGGTRLMLGDDDALPVSLPFSFPFYGRWYGQAWVNANGFLSLERGYIGGTYAVNGCLPSLANPNAAIYALWDDLSPDQGSRIAYGSTADGRFVVEWRDVPNKLNAIDNSFQVILGSDGRITLVYAQVGDMNGATVGLESWDASLSWPSACNGAGAPPVAPGMRVFQAALPSQ
jgi:subtilisin family serine protease